MSIRLKDFQESAIEKLSLTFLDLWKTGKYNIPIIFKAPTGSGKTIMMAEFLRCLDVNYQFHEDKAYLWISFGGDDSYSQSKNKLYHYFNQGTDMSLKDINNLSEGKLYKNNILFVNWAKIRGTNIESRRLRRPSELTEGDYGVFDEFIKKTKEERDIVLIIDEAHTEADTTLADEVLNLIKPRIIIKVTATPRNIPDGREINQKKAGFVEVLEEDVIKSGLIKEKIIIQTEEEIKNIENQELDVDQIMLELAFNKRIELKGLYNESNLDINPLVLIQLPSDERERGDVVSNKKDMVWEFLKQKNVNENEIGIWLANEKKNLELIERNSSEVNFMIFKVAPATGWDCPRADILVMFREIENPSFHTQIIGRIKRMPEGVHYAKEELNKAYIYTNYNKDHIKNINEVKNINKPPVYYTKIKNEIQQIRLITVYHHRTDYNTLTPPSLWQKSFLESLDKFFSTKLEFNCFSENIKNIGDNIDLKLRSVNNTIIADAEIESFDNFAGEIKEKARTIDCNFSQTDIERLYNLLCFEEIKKQDEDDAKYNPSRSWGQLKQALNVWFNTRFGLDREDWYKIAVNELLEPNSKLKIAIHNALKEFRKTYNIEIKEKEAKEIFEILVPEKEMSFTEDFEKLEILKNAYNEFYIRKEYHGRENEIRFIQFLETQKIDWWHKQEDSGRSVFAIEYYDSQEMKNRLFYPDFVVKNRNIVYLLDTKSGITARSGETANKSNALQKWIKKNKSTYDFEIKGGIVIFTYPNWLINRKDNYVYEGQDDWECLNLE